MKFRFIRKTEYKNKAASTETTVQSIGLWWLPLATSGRYHQLGSAAVTTSWPDNTVPGPKDNIVKPSRRSLQSAGMSRWCPLNPPHNHLHLPD
ncbi:hypothetical protein ElyMa_004137100 [Elysia marginata]|uniref:Uncharacterized protein n=1 Tax=Elysia marginata TaxID=1093978 RepID=A0AAV4GEI6_9GAST|nr:hypothetical protein ElyMa_004137100 [Elysia marginata]